jgi:hypothetical protein
MNGATWTTRDREIVETLAAKVRVLSLAQVARGWWNPSQRREEHARTRLRLLRRAGLLDEYRVNLHPPLELRGPAFRWSPGDGDPDAEAVARQLQARWTEAARPTTVYTASPLAANLFGCTGGELPDLTHRDHDLLLGEVFVTYLLSEPDIARRRWIGEATRPKAGFRIKDPDAFLVDDAGNTLRVVESGGKYDAERVTTFHEHCVENRLTYELW